MAGGLMISSAGDVHKGPHQSRATLAVVLVALTASSGGLIFGYDLGIAGGVLAQSSFQARFFPEMLNPPAEVDPFCKYNDHFAQLFTSSLFLAAAVAALVAGLACDRWGRRVTMMAGGALFGLGTVLVAAAQSIGMLVAGRLLLGVGVGCAAMATPIYLSEMAPFSLRGALNILFNFAITLGIFSAQLINAAAAGVDGGWRVGLALGGVPAAILFLGAAALPETPNSLLARGRSDEAFQVLQRIRGTYDVDAEHEHIAQSVRAAQASASSSYHAITRRRYLPQLVISICIPAFQQLSGVNSIFFYSVQLFQAAGFGGSASFLSTVVLGGINCVSTFVAIAVVDRFGRRPLFFAGGVTMLVCELLMGALIRASMEAGSGRETAIALLAACCIFVFSFAWSWGPLSWLVPSEIQALETRAAGMAIATCSNFLFTFVIGQTFLSMLCGMKNDVFFMFAALVLSMTVFVGVCLPETRGVPVEEAGELMSRHWLWKRVAGETTVREAGGERGEKNSASGGRGEEEAFAPLLGTG